MEKSADEAIISLIDTLAKKADTHIALGDLAEASYYMTEIAKLRASMNPTIVQQQNN